MKRRNFIKNTLLGLSGLVLAPKVAFSKTFLTIEQAQKILYPEQKLTLVPITLTEEQMESIEDAVDIRVRHDWVKAWRTEDNDWFIVDQVIGKHENIDLAVSISKEGNVTGIEVLTYRESYGSQIMHPKWRAQFHGKNSSEFLKLDKQIKNISGATLSCRHVTDGINRLNETWKQVLSLL
ncbi:FMN-binding protein [Pseudocolwellia sp. AS88]|jgi:Na+-translocating ferredoxin:NAD+ oxidoreductase RnfG subunit|uniref:FMN-binding protein n=1 Tax=Pseudocolwellia sp. AS88 TaxID=3063958 RepID=UPI0026EBBC62|nr:FMN-binding protein [Pseudocolwellia sp. AS88]MDO7086653.1 FMN-binding protein [Pseudocolwellia sp. AS88]